MENIHQGHREKMRQRFLKSGLEGFADHEALELLLYYAIPRQDTNPIAHRLMDRYGSLTAVLSAPGGGSEKGGGHRRERRRAAEGGGTDRHSKARLADAAAEPSPVPTWKPWAPTCWSATPGKPMRWSTSCAWIEKGKLLACKRLSEGGASSAALDIRKVVENAILTSASTVILAHNHPSGIALPSDDDCAATTRAARALQTIGVTLADHIIVADDDFVSMAQSGYLGPETGPRNYEQMFDFSTQMCYHKNIASCTDGTEPPPLRPQNAILACGVLFWKTERSMPKFEVVSPYQPSGDQPEAIAALAEGIENGLKEQVLAGRHRLRQDLYHGQGH